MRGTDVRQGDARDIMWRAQSGEAALDPIHLDDQHRLIRDQLRRFVTEEVKPHGEAWEEAGMIPREVLRRFGALGFFGLRVPEEHGGAGLDAIASVVLAEELGRSTFGGFSVTVLVHTDMASPHLYRAGSEAQIERYGPGLLSGKTVSAIAVTEAEAGSDVQNLRTTARRSGNGWVLEGTKMFITNAAHGNLLFVAARTDMHAKPSRGMSMFIVETDTPGVKVARKLRKMGWHSSDTAELAFEEVKLPADALLGEEGAGFYSVMENFQTERLVAAALYMAEAETAIALTLDYVKTRKAFGGTLWDKQAIRQRLAMLAAQVEAGRQLVYHTAWLDAQGHDCVKEVSMAKAWGGELVNQAIYACQQFHGGTGYMHGTAIERMARDVRIHTIGGGATEVMLEEVAKRMGD